MAKTIKHEELTKTLALTECTDGFWLYDTTRKMNLAMRAKSEREAFLEALAYYQERLMELETNYREISSKVHVFVSQFEEEE